MTAAPYPADTRAKGWRFELDHERIRQSDTWALTPADLRPWLLMLWMVAWEQTPCGSLPDDDELIAARIDMPMERFVQIKAKLLRRWWKADDGRLYHDVIVSRVHQMIETRAKEAARKAGYRERTPPVVPRESRGTDNTGTGTSKETTPPPTAVAPLKVAKVSRPDDVTEQVWNDWNELRRKKRAPVTETVLTGARREAGKAGMSFDAFLAVWCRRGSQGLEADWLKPEERASGETPWQRNQRERVAQMSGGLVSAPPPGAKAPPSLVEVIHDSPLAIGRR